MKYAIGIDKYNQTTTDEVTLTLRATGEDSPPSTLICYSMEVFHCVSDKEKTAPLKARDYKDPLVVVYECDNNNDEYLPDGE